MELLTPNETNETVPVWQAGGAPCFCKWLGVISRDEAKKLGRPVRLIISRIDSYDLKDDEFVQGCWTSSGVYAVVDVSIISASTEPQAK